jgi:hypothetical protein
MGGGGKVTVGYRYFVGLHMAIAHTVDAIERIRVGGRTAWTGDQTAADTTQTYTPVSSGSVTSAPPNDSYQGGIDLVQRRYDRVLIDRETLDFKVVTGTPSDFSPLVPTYDQSDIPIALLYWYWSKITDQYEVNVDNSARETGTFASGSDCQVSHDGGTDFSITSGDLAYDRLSQLFIDAPGLFGGEKREGGVQGAVDVAFGGPGQRPNPYLERVIGTMPAFIGITTLIARQIYVGTIPRLKPWWITARRAPAAWSNAPSATIGPHGDANPAHCVYECITNPDWGLGWDESTIDTASFTDAANTLAGEDFRLSLVWADANQPVEQLVRDQFMRHVDGSTYLDPGTGLWRLKLHRADYQFDDLEVWDQSKIVEVREFGTPGWGEIVGEVTVRYVDGEGDNPTWKRRSVTQHNQATIRAQGGRVISRTLDFPGIVTGDLANRVCARELAQLSQPLSRGDIVVTADVDDARPGDVKRLTDPDYGITDLVVRIVEVEYGTLDDGQIRVKVIQDVFAAGQAVFADPQPTEWVDPVNDPAPAPYRRLTEASYYQVARALGDLDVALEDVDETTGYLTTQAVRPSGDAFGYEVQVDTGAGYTDRGNGDFCPTATLSAAVTADANDLPIDLATAEDLADVEPGTYAYLGDEIIGVIAADPVTGFVYANRGVIDTVPQPHAPGARIFFGDGFESQGQTEYTDGGQIDVKLLPSTSLGELALTAAPSDSLTFDARFIRPYPPGKVRFNGADLPVAIDGLPPLALTWAHRDRTQQTADLIDQDAGDIGPEAGTTYTLRLYDQNDILRRTESGLSGTSYDYTRANEDADGGPFTALRLELEAERDGWTSWQHHDIATDLAGYGRRYGDYYGGAP